MRAALVPGVIALLPEYAGIEDPVAELRAACLAAVRWLDGDVVILGDPQGERVGKALLAGVGGFEARFARTSTTGDARFARTSTTGGTVVEVRGALAPSLETTAGPSYLVVGNGSARRSERAPGHLDERSFDFDDELRSELTTGDVSGLDRTLGAELLASLDGVAALGDVLPRGARVAVDYDDDPFGVQYWVMRWEW